MLKICVTQLLASRSGLKREKSDSSFDIVATVLCCSFTQRTAFSYMFVLHVHFTLPCLTFCKVICNDELQRHG